MKYLHTTSRGCASVRAKKKKKKKKKKSVGALTHIAPYKIDGHVLISMYSGLARTDGLLEFLMIWMKQQLS